MRACRMRRQGKGKPHQHHDPVCLSHLRYLVGDASLLPTSHSRRVGGRRGRLQLAWVLQNRWRGGERVSAHHAARRREEERPQSSGARALQRLGRALRPCCPADDLGCSRSAAAAVLGAPVQRRGCCPLPSQ